MNPEDIVIRKMGVEDVPRVVDIERRVFAMPWTPGMFAKETSAVQDSLPLVALAGDRLIGYAVLWFVGVRVHLANIAVDAKFRRLGIGRMLLERVFEETRRRGSSKVSLETRVSNQAAVGLFRKMRFRTVTISHGYYTDNDEDALVMVRSLEGVSRKRRRDAGSDSSRPLSPVPPPSEG